MKKGFIFISFNAFFNRILSCLVISFIMLTSLNMSCAGVGNMLGKTISISAETIFTQFFYISSIPVNIISGLFAESRESALAESDKAGKKNKKSEESNSTKASIGYAIVPADNTFNLKVQSRSVKTGSNGGNKNIVTGAEYFSFYGRDIYKFEGNKYDGGINNVFIIMLLLAILIARRNIGDNNIINKKIEYKNQPDFEI